IRFRTHGARMSVWKKAGTSARSCWTSADGLTATAYLSFAPGPLSRRARCRTCADRPRLISRHKKAGQARLLNVMKYLGSRRQDRAFQRGELMQELLCLGTAGVVLGVGDVLTGFLDA